MARKKPKPYEVVRWMKVKSGTQIKRHRIRKDLTQRQLAFLVGKTQTTIYLLESGQMTTLSERLALDIAKRLDMPWEDLFESREAVRVPGMTTGASTENRAEVLARREEIPA